MRAIDGDALKERYENHRKLYCKNRIEFKLLSEKDKARVDELDNCIADILNAPTIEPEREKGQWMVFETENERYEDIKCPFCKKTYTVDAYRTDDIGFIAEDFKFCLNCGSDMREGDQDE